jgi:hypothetical protein
MRTLVLFLCLALVASLAAIAQEKVQVSGDEGKILALQS